MNSNPIDWQRIAAEYAQKTRSPRLAEPKSPYRTSPTGTPQIPASQPLRDYQHQAVLRWLQNQGRGTLKMATGSGKTIVALAITTELYEKIRLQVLLVVCPYRHLVTQWARECEKFNLHPLLAFESVRQWQNQLSTQLYNIQSAQQPFLTLITTNSTFLTESFQSQLKFFPAKTLIIGDEAHNLGSPQLEAKLPRTIGLRLALSATPERYFDDRGTDLLLNYFGDILQPEFTLADAIQQGALVPYLYYPLFVHLSEAETRTYAKLTQRIGWAMAENENMVTNTTLTALLMQRSRLIGSAVNKLATLRYLMSQRLHTTHTLFYCGDGYIEGGSKRQLAAVTRLLGSELGYRVNTYTADTPLKERERMREQFERGELQGLIAIRCLDEGIDIPAIQNAVILASTSNPRQFIQRRGRILRPHPGKKRATLFDTIVIPPELDRETWEIERNLLRKELQRFLEFAELADNATEAKTKLLALQEEYEL
ncbi:DNA phosphorothioation system restriction enzyme [Lusitaniella coriacea LEGE 07157]|uniref:DNA phosphorothioation system restriction enzyme n=1 Tax=Lusitaniella coriacea LEGE 07157 TaxID=945747 RepID=A0A8J7DWN1_9CYAN|nr:DNA phosphorothioation system restriction enzyme [Lusitaniella coriacea]MBE9116587.1 DNA phosphorothioation system restriction enzyme [Lusitaniella coriacea LEGE 07157]